MLVPKPHTYSKILAAVTFFLIVAGGLVTSTKSGLSVPDWPLSYGQAFPPMIGGIRFEHSHRVLAGLTGILTFGLTIVFFLKEKRKWVIGLAVLASLLVVAQAVLGGLTVIYLLPTSISVLHACIAQTFFCLVVALALLTSSEWSERSAIESQNTGSLKRLVAITTLFIYAQLVAGSFVRHTHGSGINFHFVFAFLIALHSLLIILKISRESQIQARFFNHAILLGLFVLIQIFLGLGAFAFTLALARADIPPTHEVLFTTAHQAMGALILVTSFTLTLRVCRLVK